MLLKQKLENGLKKNINSGLNGLKPDLCSAGKVLCQWSYRANWELVVIWVHEKPVVCGYLTNRFHVAVHLFNNRSQMTSKYSKNKKWYMRGGDLFLNQCTGTWNLCVLYNKGTKLMKTAI